MDAPKCQKIPGCGKRHFGECAESGNESRAAGEPAQEENAPRVYHSPESPIDLRSSTELELEERVTQLEQIVDELLAGKRKRSAYMKAYMRDRRARDASIPDAS